MGFVRRARSQTNRLESAKELKKLVFFSNMVIAPLVEDLQVCVRVVEVLRCFVELLRCVVEVLRCVGCVVEMHC